MKAMRLSSEQRLVDGLTQEECLMKFLPKVRQIARHVGNLMSYQSYYDDLVSTGMMGLMDAFIKYDPKKFASFNTYASIRIRGSMIDEIRNQSWVPRSVITKSKDISEIHEKFEKGLGRRATDHELSQELGLKGEELQDFMRGASIGKVLNIDDYRSFNDKDRSSFIEKVDSINTDPNEQIDRIRMKEMLEKCTEHLKDKQKEVILLFYYEGLKNVEISERLGISESRVCQLHRDALKMLRRSKDISLLYKCMIKNIAA